MGGPPFLMELGVWWRRHMWRQRNVILHDKYNNREMSSKLSSEGAQRTEGQSDKRMRNIWCWDDRGHAKSRK